MSDPIITFDHVVKEFKTRGRGANIARAVDDVSLGLRVKKCVRNRGFSRIDL